MCWSLQIEHPLQIALPFQMVQFGLLRCVNCAFQQVQRRQPELFTHRFGQHPTLVVAPLLQPSRV